MHFVCKTENKMVDKSQFVGKKNGNFVVSKERVLISICYEKKNSVKSSQPQLIKGLASNRKIKRYIFNYFIYM
jgi:hypothetical protein